MIAEKDGEVVGAALTLPDINQVLAKMNGACCRSAGCLPAGKRKIDRVRVFALGVKPEYQHTGVAAGALRRHIETAAEAGCPAARRAGSSRPTSR